LTARVHVWLKSENARRLHQSHIGIGTNVVCIRRKIEFGVVAHHLSRHNKSGDISFGIEFESNGNVQIHRFTIRMDMQVEVDLRTGRYQVTRTFLEGVAVLPQTISLDQRLAAVRVYERGPHVMKGPETFRRLNLD